MNTMAAREIRLPEMVNHCRSGNEFSDDFRQDYRVTILDTIDGK
jgi:hypothetical protein